MYKGKLFGVKSPKVKMVFSVNPDIQICLSYNTYCCNWQNLWIKIIQMIKPLLKSSNFRSIKFYQRTYSNMATKYLTCGTLTAY